MKNLSRFIPIDGVNESLGENEVTTENGGIVVGYESNTMGSKQGSESVLNNIDESIESVEAELERILVGAGTKPEIIGEGDTKCESAENILQNFGGGNTSDNSGTYEIVGSNGTETATTNSSPKFKVCGTNLPAKISFWSKLKSFFKTEIAIELPFSNGNSSKVSGNTSNETGNGTGENTSGGTGWSGLKNFFSFGKNK